MAGPTGENGDLAVRLVDAAGDQQHIGRRGDERRRNGYAIEVLGDDRGDQIADQKHQQRTERQKSVHPDRALPLWIGVFGMYGHGTDQGRLEGEEGTDLHDEALIEGIGAGLVKRGGLDGSIFYIIMGLNTT